jgi:4-amino-4-deoxy-L-arabinose transferase-like glycosyltransferase
MNKIIKFFLKYVPRHHLLLASIVLIGVCVRFYQVLNGMPWGDDAGRDLLVAKHIVEHGASWLSSPPASGTPFFDNTPLYFWLVALFYLLGRTVSSVVIMFTLMGVVTIILAYILGKEVRNSFVGLVFAALVSFSYITVIPSRSILQPNLMGMLIVLTLLFYTRFHRSESFRDGLLLVVCMFCGVALHLGYLPVLVFFSIALIWEVVRARRLHKSILIFLLYYMALFIWVLAYIKVPQVREFFMNNSSLGEGITLEKLGLGLLAFFNYLFFGAPKVIKIILGEIAVGLLILRAVPRHLSPLSILFKLSALFWVCALALVCAVYGNNAPYYYYDAFYIVALFGFAILVDRVTSQKSKILLAILFIVGTAYSTKSIVTSELRNEFISAKTVSIKVLDDYIKYDDHAGTDYNFWIIAAQGDYPGVFGMFSEQYWYVLETLTKQQLTKIVSGPQNSRPIVASPRFIYLICKVGEFYFASKEECVSQMTIHYSYDFARLINPTLVDKVASPFFTLYILRFEHIQD